MDGDGPGNAGKRKTHGRAWRWPARIAGGLAIAAVLVGGLSFGWAVWTLPRTEGEVVVSGLAAPVDIVRDANGVPHIFADSDEDAYFALGFVHAQDRLWQMEFMRRLGAGRLAEVLGEPGLNADRFLRTMGLARLAEGDAAALNPKTRATLEFYAAGVNAWLAEGTLPPEFTVLGHKPEPWRITDSLLWERLMALRLALGWSNEVFRTRLAERLPPQSIDELWPADPPGSPYTYNARQLAGFDLPRLLDAVPDEVRSQSASNAWVVDGRRSGTGAPVLANDPHLGFAAPGVWYLARIVTPDLTVTGATAPGVPFTVLGHNGHVAWGITATEVDSQDLFVETVDPANAEQYLTPGGPLPFSTREETILVDGGEPVTLTVRNTRHGPVLSDLPDVAPDLESGTVLALAAANLAPDDVTANALSAMNDAGNAGAFRAALTEFTGPTVNIFYADVTGVIGVAARGRMPRRTTGRGPFSGVDGKHDWTGFLPLDSLPGVENPPSGRLANGNNRMLDSESRVPIEGFWYAQWRAERMLEILDAGAHGPDDAVLLQNDLLSGAARRLVPLMLETAGSFPEGTDRQFQVYTLLSNWDYRMERDRPEPLIYLAWLRHAVRAIAADELGEDFTRYEGPRARFVEAVLTKNRHWCKQPNGPRPICAAEMTRALEAALDELTTALGSDIPDWRWGDLHRATFANRLLGRVPVIGRFANLSIPSDGGEHTINRGVTAGSGETPYANIHGPGFRAVYDLANLENSRFMIAAGQSGNPFSAHYDDLLEPWRDGDSFRLAGTRDELVSHGAGHLALVPQPR